MSNIDTYETTGWTHWIGFAGFFLALSGIVHFLYGLGALFNQDWYVYASGDIYWVDITTWGWSMIAAGALLILSSALLLSGNMVGRIIGTMVATAGVLVNLALIGATPVWSILAIIVNLIVIYAIVAHGKEMKHLG
jgi:hypothetical protein